MVSIQSATAENIGEKNKEERRRNHSYKI